MTIHMRTQRKGAKLKAVLILYGEANAGKSTALTRLAVALLENSSFYYEQKKTRVSRDRRVVARHGKWIIGIGTAGDDKKQVDENFTFFSQQRCNIGIVAARKTGSIDMKTYSEKKAAHKKAKVGSLELRSMKASFAKEIVNAACVDKLLMALKCHNVMTMINSL